MVATGERLRDAAAAGWLGRDLTQPWELLCAVLATGTVEWRENVLGMGLGGRLWGSVFVFEAQGALELLVERSVVVTSLFSHL